MKVKLKSQNLFLTHTKDQLVKKKKKNIPTNSNTNYCKEKLVPIKMNYCLLQFDALKFVLEVRI